MILVMVLSSWSWYQHLWSWSWCWTWWFWSCPWSDIVCSCSTFGCWAVGLGIELCVLVVPFRFCGLLLCFVEFFVSVSSPVVLFLSSWSWFYVPGVDLMLYCVGMYRIQPDIWWFLYIQSVSNWRQSLWIQSGFVHIWNLRIWSGSGRMGTFWTRCPCTVCSWSWSVRWDSAHHRSLACLAWRVATSAFSWCRALVLPDALLTVSAGYYWQLE